MKKLTAVLMLTLLPLVSFAEDTCYYFITEIAQKNFEVYRGHGLKTIFTNVVSAECGTYEAGISNQYNDALKAKYPDSYYETRSPTAWGPYRSRAEAERAKRKKKGDLGRGWKTIDFYFSYYEH